MICVALLLLAAGCCVKCETLTQSASVTVQPGQRLIITCQVSYSVGSYYTAWIRQPAGQGLEWIGMKHTGVSYHKDSLKNKFSIDLDTSNKIVTLNGQNMQPEDTAVYYCVRGGSYFDYWGKGTTVTVTSATVTRPTVFPLQPCDMQDGTGMISYACLATGFTPSALTYTWTVNDRPFADSIQYPPVLKNNFYTGVSQIQVRRQDWNNTQLYKCRVEHQGENREVIIKPAETIYELPTLTVSASDGENDVTFSCLAKEFSPKTHEFKWLKNNQEITGNKHEITTTSEGKQVNGTTMYSAASFLTVASQDLERDAEYMCQFKGKGEGGAATFLNSTVTYRPTSDPPCEGNLGESVKVNIIHPSLEDMFLNGRGQVLCEVSSTLVPVYKIYWLNHDGKEMSDGAIEPGLKKGKFTAPLLVSYDEWNNGIQCECRVELDGVIEPIIRPYRRASGGNPQRPSVFMLPPIEHTKKESVTLTCYVKDFFPADILVSWLIDDEQLESNSEYEYNTTNPVENSGTYYAYAHLSVTADKWKETDTVYSCVVYHESVINTTKTIVRSIGHRSLETTNLVNLNMNIPETCKSQ